MVLEQSTTETQEIAIVSENTLYQEIKLARDLSVPIVGITTNDPAGITPLLQKICEEDSGPLILWNIATGLVPMNPDGTTLSKEIMKGYEDETALTGDTGLNEVLILLETMEDEGVVIVILNAHRHLEKDVTVQCLWNLRDKAKAKGNTVVLLGPDIKLPLEIQGDVLILDDPLPTRDELASIVSNLHEIGGLEEPDPSILSASVDALLGLSRFPAEQSTALALTQQGISLDKLWTRKRQSIMQAPGLSVLNEKISFDDIKGVDQICWFMKMVCAGKSKPNALVFIDEIEKNLAGATGLGGDAGVSADQLSQLLQFMQDTQALGIILVGHPGSAKSMVAKATGNTAGVPTIQLDLGGMKQGIVGSSEANLRQALKVVSAVSGGQTLFIATCNNITSLPPELRRRFQLGTFFFDFPSDEGADAIWDMYLKKYELPLDAPLDRAQCRDWTGAEINTCCKLASDLSISLFEAAQFIVPISIAAASTVKSLRQQADGCWLDARIPGFYQMPTQDT